MPRNMIHASLCTYVPTSENMMWHTAFHRLRRCILGQQQAHDQSECCTCLQGTPELWMVQEFCPQGSLQVLAFTVRPAAA